MGIHNTRFYKKPDVYRLLISLLDDTTESIY
jgi:hypothetical protein